MATTLEVLAVLCLLLATAVIALRTGLARQIFFEIYSRVAEVDVLGPSAVRIPPTNSPYQRWLTRVRNEIPVHGGLVIGNAGSVKLRAWPQMGDGVNGLYLRLADYQTSDARILEIPARGKTTSQRHLYEQGIYFMGGPGHTIIQQEGAQPQHFNWQAGTFFASPTYWYHQHFNPGATPARYLSINMPDLLSNLGLRFSDQMNVDLKEVKVEWEQKLEKSAREH